MNKLLGMQARSTDKAALTDKIRFLKRITPMVAAGFVKLLPVSVLFDPPRETPIFYSDNYFEDALPAEVLRLFRDHALVKSVRRAGKVWRVEDELLPCRAIYIEYQGHPNVHGEFCTYHDNAVKLDEEDRTVQFTIKRPDSAPSPERFAVWVRQSVNRAAQDLYTQTFGELMLARSIGALYCTRSELLAGVLKMQIRPTDSIPVHTTNTVMNLELPFLTDVQIDQLMRVRTEEGEAFHNFRTELDKQLRYLRTIDDPEKASRKAKDAVHELVEVQIRDISNKLASLKEKLWFRAAISTIGLLAAVQTSGISLLASATAVVEPALEYRKEIKRHPAFFLWKILKR